MIVVREGGRWGLFYVSATGIRTRAKNVVILDELPGGQSLGTFPGDIFYENGECALHPGVKRKN